MPKLTTIPATLATQLRSVGISADQLNDKGAIKKAIVHTVEGTSATALLDAVEDLSRKDLMALQKAVGDAPVMSHVAKETGRGVRVSRFHIEGQLSRALSPDAALAATTYLPKRKDPIERPLERVLLHVGRLHSELSASTSTDKLIDALLKNDSRKHVFMLQGMLRLYRDIGPKKEIDKQLASVKQLEDALGAYGYQSDMLAAAVKHKAPSGAIAHLTTLQQQARATLEEVIEDGWMFEDGRSPRLNDVADLFADMKLGKPKHDVAYVRDALRQIVDNIIEDDLDMNELEAGLHELRRDLRWIGIDMIALDGLVALDDTQQPIARLEALKQDPIAKSPFAQLPESTREPDTIRIPRSVFLALSKAIGELGKAKDRGQVIEGLAHALVAGGTVKGDHYSANAHAEKLVGDVGGLQQVIISGKRIHRDLIDGGVLKALSAALGDA